MEKKLTHIIWGCYFLLAPLSLFMPRISPFLFGVLFISVFVKNKLINLRYSISNGGHVRWGGIKCDALAATVHPLNDGDHSSWHVSNSSGVCIRLKTLSSRLLYAYHCWVKIPIMDYFLNFFLELKNGWAVVCLVAAGGGGKALRDSNGGPVRSELCAKTIIAPQNDINVDNRKIFSSFFISISFFVFILWSLIVCFWAVDLSSHYKVFLKVISFVFFGTTFLYQLRNSSEDFKRNCLKWALFGGYLGAFLLLVDYSLNSPLAHYKETDMAHVYAKIALILSSVGLIPLFIFDKLKGVLLSFIIGGALFFGDCDAAVLGFFAAFFLFLCSLLKKQFIIIRFLSFGFVILTTLFLPIAMQSFFESDYINRIQYGKTIKEFSYYHRIDIWREVVKKIMEKPFLGHGFESTQNEDLMDGKKEIIRKNLETNQNELIIYKIFHPHNHILQLWIELGFIGSLAWLLLSLGVLIRTKDNLFLFLTFVCLHAHLWVSIGLWQTWWWCFLIMFVPLLKDYERL